jgi:hypothetical protein
LVALIPPYDLAFAMSRGLVVGIYLQPNLRDEAFVAEALGNLAAFELQRRREEILQWQVLRVDGSPGQHHYRLVIRHPDRMLDLGLKNDLAGTLTTLSKESEEDLARRLAAAKIQGLRMVPVRSVHESVDYWRDDFWNWLG